MYKYIIFSELCPGHNPRKRMSGLGWGIGIGGKGIGQRKGRKLKARGIDYWGMGLGH